MSMLYKIASVIVLLSSSFACGQVNLLTNPGFEHKLQGWQTSISHDAKVIFDLVTQDNNPKNHVLMVTNQSPRTPHVFGRIIQEFKVTPSTRYRMGFRIKAQNASGMIFGGGKDWKVRRDVPSGTYDWQDVSFIYTTGPDENKFMFHVIFEGISEKIWLDDFIFQDMALVDAASSVKINTMQVSDLGSEKFYPARKADHINLDGKFNDWDDREFITIPGSNIDQLSTKLALRYDDDKLYLAILCSDDQHVAFPGDDM
jgi:hypothetical protein